MCNCSNNYLLQKFFLGRGMAVIIMFPIYSTIIDQLLLLHPRNTYALLQGWNRYPNELRSLLPLIVRIWPRLGCELPRASITPVRILEAVRLGVLARWNRMANATPDFVSRRQIIGNRHGLVKGWLGFEVRIEIAKGLRGTPSQPDVIW